MDTESSVPETVTVTSANLKGLAHPLRMRILGLLRMDGSATATMLATRLGLNSGALSYHLRQLERYGFIVEDETLGTGRDRWWRAAHRSTSFAQLRENPETTDAADLITDQLVERSIDRLNAAARQHRQWPEAWRDHFDVSDIVLDLTPEEAGRLSNELSGVLRSYRRHQPGTSRPDGAEPFLVQYQAFPYSGSPS